MCQRLMLLLRLIKVKQWPKNPLHLSPSPNKTRPKNAGMRILTRDDHAYFSDLCMPFLAYFVLAFRFLLFSSFNFERET